jgi:hypothetical protein
MSIQDWVGKEFPLFAMPVERGKIREFANAIGSLRPEEPNESHSF